MKAAAFGAAARAATGCAAARLVAAAIEQTPRPLAQRMTRANFRGRQVSLLGGPALVVPTLVCVAFDRRIQPRVRRGAVVAGTVAALAGLIDDCAGTAAARGLRGHLGALRRGRFTTGAAKIVLIGAGGLAAGWQVGCTDRAAGRRSADPSDGRADLVFRTVTAGGVIAASANLANLLDLRPGRALKAALAVTASIALRGSSGGRVAAITGGCAAGVLPLDLGERVMLGDTGANFVGAMLGVAAVTGASRRKLLGLFGALAALTAASEVVSFSAVIDNNAALSWIDRLGRRTGDA